MVKVTGLFFHIGYLVNPAPFIEKNILSSPGLRWSLCLKPGNRGPVLD